MIGRRSFVRALGLLPAAAASPAETLKTAGIERTMGSYVGAVVTSGSDDTAVTQTEAQAERASAWVLANGLPQYVLDAVRRDRRVPHGLDPDLAAYRSFSLAAKVAIQRERDFQRACADTLARERTNMARRAMKALTGFSFWW